MPFRAIFFIAYKTRGWDLVRMHSAGNLAPAPVGGLLWRAGLSERRIARAGWRSRPKTWRLGMSETIAVPGVGLLRSPTRAMRRSDKPARHRVSRELEA